MEIALAEHETQSFGVRKLSVSLVISCHFRRLSSQVLNSHAWLFTGQSRKAPMKTRLAICLVALVAVVVVVAILSHPLIIVGGVPWVGQTFSWLISPHIVGERGSPAVESLVAAYEGAHRLKDLTSMHRCFLGTTHMSSAIAPRMRRP